VVVAVGTIRSPSPSFCQLAAFFIGRRWGFYYMVSTDGGGGGGDTCGCIGLPNSCNL
jgi:hypothetical protein